MASELRLRESSGAVRLFRMVACLALVLTLAPAAWAAFDPAAVFVMKCSGCHSVGKGDVVGPDLAGVAQRRDKRWLHSFIRSSQGLVGRGEKTAGALFAKYKKKMPDHDFSDDEIDALLAFIQAGGPREPMGELRRASTATPAEVARGRELFAGRLALRNGGAACAGCHAAGAVGRWRAGTLGGDLSRVYDKYQDAGLTRALVESRSPMMWTTYRERPLTPDEVFAIKAFLHAAARAPEPAMELASGAPLFLGFGGSSLFLLLTGHLLRRRGGPRKPGRGASGGDAADLSD
jgi:mono/diheme cytochrome c family protein